MRKPRYLAKLELAFMASLLEKTSISLGLQLSKKITLDFEDDLLARHNIEKIEGIEDSISILIISSKKHGSGHLQRTSGIFLILTC